MVRETGVLFALAESLKFVELDEVATEGFARLWEAVFEDMVV